MAQLNCGSQDHWSVIILLMKSALLSARYPSSHCLYWVWYCYTTFQLLSRLSDCLAESSVYMVDWHGIIIVIATENIISSALFKIIISGLNAFDIMNGFWGFKRVLQHSFIDLIHSVINFVYTLFAQYWGAGLIAIQAYIMNVPLTTICTFISYDYFQISIRKFLLYAYKK